MKRIYMTMLLVFMVSICHAQVYRNGKTFPDTATQTELDTATNSMALGHLTNTAANVDSANDNDVLTWDSATGLWTAEPASGGVGEVNTITSVGAFTSLVSGKVGVDLQVKSLKPGAGIELSATSSNVTITVTGLVTKTEFQTSNNIFRVDIDSLVTETSKYLRASATNNLVETFSSVGAGTSILSGKVGVDLQFKSLVPGSGITFTDSPTQVTISADVAVETDPVWSGVSNQYYFVNNPSNFISNVVEDITPQLGGDLDANGKKITDAGGRLNIDDTLFVTNGVVGIGTDSPDGSSILDLVSTNKGFFPPRMTTTQRLAISSPTEGLIVYDTTVSNFFGHNGTKYVRLDLEMAGGCLFRTNTFPVGTGTVSLTFNFISEPLTNVTLIGGLGGSEFENNIKDQVTYNLEPQFNRNGGGGQETIVAWYEISTNSGVSWIKGESIMDVMQNGESSVSPLTVCVVGNGKRIRFRAQGTDESPTLEFIAVAAGEKTSDHPIIPAYILTID